MTRIHVQQVALENKGNPVVTGKFMIRVGMQPLSKYLRIRSEPGLPGEAGRTGLPGNMPHVPLNAAGTCIPCPFGPPGHAGQPGCGGPQVMIGFK